MDNAQLPSLQFVPQRASVVNLLRVKAKSQIADRECET